VWVSLTIAIDDEALIAVANTRHGTEAWRPLPPPDRLISKGVVDRLGTPRDAVAFLRALQIAVPSALPTTDQLVRLRDVRECARTLAEGDRRGFTRRLTKLLGGARVAVAPDGALRMEAAGWDAFADALCVALVDLDRRRRRVRLCHNAACAWLFIDTTRNNSQVWCTAQLCGDRLRVRRARRRAALGGRLT
jgi:predicted RNA-binding Zn ribbon-like protein